MGPTATALATALVACASVTQLISFGGKFVWSEDTIAGEASVRVSGPLDSVAEVLRPCLSASWLEDEAVASEQSGSEGLYCVPCSSDYLQDPGEQTVLGGLAWCLP